MKFCVVCVVDDFSRRASRFRVFASATCVFVVNMVYICIILCMFMCYFFLCFVLLYCCFFECYFCIFLSKVRDAFRRFERGGLNRRRRRRCYDYLMYVFCVYLFVLLYFLFLYDIFCVLYLFCVLYFIFVFVRGVVRSSSVVKLCLNVIYC